MTVKIQSKNSEPQTTITKFTINIANWDLFTSNEAWKKVTNPNRSQSAEALTEDFYKKKSLVRASADCDRFGFVTFFHSSIGVKMCQFALLMLNFVIVVWGS